MIIHTSSADCPSPCSVLVVQETLAKGPQTLSEARSRPRPPEPTSNTLLVGRGRLRAAYGVPGPLAGVSWTRRNRRFLSAQGRNANKGLTSGNGRRNRVDLASPPGVRPQVREKGSSRPVAAFGRENGLGVGLGGQGRVRAAYGVLGPLAGVCWTRRNRCLAPATQIKDLRRGIGLEAGRLRLLGQGARLRSARGRLSASGGRGALSRS